MSDYNVTWFLGVRGINFESDIKKLKFKKFLKIKKIFEQNTSASGRGGFLIKIFIDLSLKVMTLTILVF